jgi:hypothetical protein
MMQPNSDKIGSRKITTLKYFVTASASISYCLCRHGGPYMHCRNHATPKGLHMYTFKILFSNGSHSYVAYCAGSLEIARKLVLTYARDAFMNPQDIYDIVLDSYAR